MQQCSSIGRVLNLGLNNADNSSQHVIDNIKELRLFKGKVIPVQAVEALRVVRG
jgi:DUF917 family protein